MQNLYRSRNDKKIGGICGGLGENFNIDPSLIRIVLIIVTFVTGFILVPIYLLAMFVIPKEPRVNRFDSYATAHGHTGGMGNPNQPFYSNGNTGQQFQPPYPPPPYEQPFSSQSTQQGTKEQAASSSIDDMMHDVENKVLRKEIEKLKQKLEEYEKGE
ncbi:PspC domain-containing protein [Longirhabdus pacifica]|uniref:PspC domain-containing protein n=1 Tax=Longirhabdus pacifica TaxID=2305227 RepID=UPI001008A271|nr:PspC domain-containing protein [Longirhabdus pacifica]